MTGWLILILLALLSGGALWRLGMARSLWSFVVSALLLGAAGYAWQGRPGLLGHPVAAEAQAGTIDEELVEVRKKMFGRFNFDDAYFTMADAMTRAGSPRSAAQAMLGAVRKAPQDAVLWTGLGMKIAEMDHMVSPAAKMAFDRALRLAPQHPGPPFFLGVAYVRSNQFADAKRWWERAYALTPPGASYRNDVMVRLYLLDRYLQMQPQAGAAAAPAR
jgi:cytochrome c-type biogenesis protein CcmH